VNPPRLRSLILRRLEPLRDRSIPSVFLDRHQPHLARFGETLTFFGWSGAPDTEGELALLVDALPNVVVLGLDLGDQSGRVEWPLHPVRSVGEGAG